MNEAMSQVVEVWFAVGPALMLIAGYVAGNQMGQRKVVKELENDFDQDRAEEERIARVGRQQARAFTDMGSE